MHHKLHLQQRYLSLLNHIQGEDYVLVLQMEIIKLLIFGEKYQKS